MNQEPNGQPDPLPDRPSAFPNTPHVHTSRQRRWQTALTLALCCSGFAAAQGNSPTQLRGFIDQQVGGLNKLMVPAKDEDLPQPRLPNGSIDPLFQTTEAKRYLGKQLFHDPFRAVRIDPAFGGVPATAGTTSCGSCHQGESASKAGTLLNFAAGGEGRHYTDARGNFIPRRRANTAILPQLRTTPLFASDALVDELPTLADVYRLANGQILYTSPARQKLPQPGRGTLIRTGRLDAVDSVGRNAPSVIGAAFSNRFLLDGIAGETNATPGGINPLNHPPLENMTLLLLDAHRMLDAQSAAIEQVPAYRKLFRDAFPDEAALAPGCTPEANPLPAGACAGLIDDVTVLRATSTFLRTTVTRNTPWDRFLAGDNRALTNKQRNGAKLFFTAADKGGAGCYGCHSGPALNKQVNDPDVTGIGEFVEQNFYNLGLGDHPVQALNRAARNDPSFRDRGRQEITERENDDDVFKFRTVTLRQLKDARTFFHSGEFSSVKDVVKYFNAGVPRDAVSGAAHTLSKRFTHPRGLQAPRGLGLSEDQVEDLTDFIVNGLYDPAFARFDPKHAKTFFELSPMDTQYSKHRPDLAALGAIDGRALSGRPPNNDDALSRRDMGLEFLDVTSRVSIERIDSDRHGNRREDVYRITNTSNTVVDTHLLIIARGSSSRIELENASGVTSAGDPYLRVFLRNGALLPGQSIVRKLEIKSKQPHLPPAGYSLMLLSGQGNP
jgi:cytochrome c peroxidase